MFYMVVCLVLIGHCCCETLESTYSYDGRVYTIYRNVSKAFNDVNQFCVKEGHDSMANLCNPDDLTSIFPSGHDKELFWIKGPPVCEVVGACLSLWYHMTNYTDWVLTCTSCDMTRYFICETNIQGNTVSRVPTPSSRLSVCDVTTVHDNDVENVVIPVVMSYVKAERVCRIKYHGRILGTEAATHKLAVFKQIASSNTVSSFWLYKGFGSADCSVLTQAGITKSSCTFIHGLICSRDTKDVSTSVKLEEIFTHDTSLPDVICSTDVILNRKVRSVVDCASECTVDLDCQSFFFVSNTGRCQTHNDTFSSSSINSALFGAQYYKRHG